MNMNASNVTTKMPHLIPTINGGSSNIKFALFEVGGPLRRTRNDDREHGMQRFGSYNWKGI